MMPQQTPVPRQADPGLDLNGCVFEFVMSLFTHTFAQMRRVPTVLQNRWEMH